MPDDKEPIPQFAARIKAKYPQYKDMNDTLLVQKIVAKYPEYSDKVDLSGVSESSKKKEESPLSYPRLKTTSIPSRVGGKAQSYSEVLSKPELRHSEVIPEQKTAEQQDLSDDPIAYSLRPFREKASQDYKTLKDLTTYVPSDVQSVGQKGYGVSLLPIEEQNKKRNAESSYKQSSKQFADALETAYNSYFPNGKEALGYLQKVNNEKGGLPQNNETVNLAAAKADRYLALQDAVSKESNLSNLAIELARKQDPNLDKQILQLEGGRENDRGLDDYKNVIPQVMQGRMVRDLIDDPDIKELAKDNPKIQQQIDYYNSGGIYKDFPDYGRNVIRNQMSREYELNRSNKIANPIFNKSSYLDKLADKLYSDNPELKKLADEMKGHWEGKIETSGLIDEFGTGGRQSFEEFGKSVKDLLGAGEPPAERIYGELEKQYGNVESGVKGIWKDLGQAANFGGMIAGMAAQGAPLSALKMNPRLANTIVTSGNFYDQEYNKALMKNPDNPNLAKVQAAIMTGTYLAAGNAIPSGKLNKLIDKTRPGIEKELSTLESSAAAGEAKNRVLGVIKDSAKNILKGTGEMVAITKLNQEMDRLFGQTPEDQLKYHGKNEGQDELLDTARTMAIGLTAPGLIRGFANRNAVASSYLSMASYPSRYMNVMERMLMNGDISPEDFKSKVEDISFLNKTKQELDKRGLTDDDKSRYLLESMDRRYKEQDKPSVEDKTLLNQHEKELAKHDEVKEKILAGEKVEPLEKDKPFEEVSEEQPHEEKQVITPEGIATPIEKTSALITDKEGNNYQVKVEDNSEKMILTAHDKNGTEIAELLFDKNRNKVENVGVNHELHRKGIGTKLYDLAESILGFKIEPNVNSLSDDAKKFWENREQTTGETTKEPSRPTEQIPAEKEGGTETATPETAQPAAEAGQGELPTEETAPIGQSEPEGTKVGVHHAALTDLANKLGLPEPERGKTMSKEELAARGRRLLQEGADPEEVNNVNNTLHDRIAIGRAHLEDLVKNADAIAKSNPEGINSEEYKKAWEAVGDYSEKVKGLGTEAHYAFKSLQGERDIDTDSFTEVKRSLEEDLKKPASPQQEEKIKELTNINEKLKKEAEAAEAKLIEETDKAFKAGVEEGKKKSTGDKAKTVANKLRENAKLHKPGSFSAATPASVVWDAAVEIVAKGIEAGGKIADVIEEGLKHIRNSDWYKSLNDNKKELAEKEFKQFNFDNTNSISLEDLQARFVDKNDNKFTTDEAKDIWKYAKETYLDKGVSYRDTLVNVSNDLGLSWKQVSEAFTSKKVKPISDAMWKKNADYRRSQIATKNWVEAQSKSAPFKALRKVSQAFRGVAVFGHGGIFIGTHAGMTLFNPSQWKYVVPAFLRGWKFAYGNKADYERRVEQLKNSPNYVLAQRAGLKNNPDQINTEEFQKSQQFFKKIGGEAGIKGFNAIKVLRQDLFDYHYNRLSEAEKNDSESVQQIAKLVNNATGATNLKLPEWVNEVSFAGGMEAARWGKLTRNPARATAIAMKALITPSKATTAERVFAKVWARRVGEQLGTMTGLLLANAAIQNTLNPNNPTNITNPNKSDFLKFKFGDITIDPSSGMRGAALFAYGIGKIPFESKKELRGDTRTQAAGKQAFSYGRGKLAPLYSTMADFFAQSDFNKNPLPFSNDKPGAGHHKLTWGEYLWEKAPLPIAHAAQEMYSSALDNGADKVTLNHVLDGIISGVLSGGTGFRVGQYNAEEAEHSPYTKEDKKDPTFKKVINDWGMELPNTSHTSEIITDEKNKTKKQLSYYSKDIQDNYDKTHKEYLKEELKKVMDSNKVYVKEYTDEKGNKVSQVSLTHTSRDQKKKSIDELNKEEKAQLLRIAQEKATVKTKKELFNQK